MRQGAIFANAEVVLPERVMRGWLRVEAGEIVETGAGDAVPAGAVDCGGDYLSPGLVELHTDNLERHIQPRPKVDWPHAAAILAHDAELASCGITTVFDAMRVGFIPNGKLRYGSYARGLATELLDLRRRDRLRISHFLHLRAEVCSETLTDEMAAFGPEDLVGIVSLMDHTPGQRQFRDMEKLRAYTMGKHSMSEADYTAHIDKLRALRARLGDAHEVAAVAEARRYGAVLASHDDTTVAHVKASAAHGMRLAEFPTSLEAAQACRDRGIAVMMGAPNLIRGGSHSGNVAAQDLAQAGLLDILSSDYVPSALLFGAVRLGLQWDDLARGIATVTQAPAGAAGLCDRGSIAPGQRADLLRFAVEDGVPIQRGVWSRGVRVA